MCMDTAIESLWPGKQSCVSSLGQWERNGIKFDDGIDVFRMSSSAREQDLLAKYN